MMRLLGVLVGSALAVAALVVFVGIPEFTTETSVAENNVITLPIRPDTNGAPEPEPVKALPEVPEPVAEIETPGEMLADTNEMPADAQPPDETFSEAEPIETMQQWYAFWSPFRSEIAATGLVDQLQRVTGLDYRVVKIKPGVYEVAFAYGNDDEIITNLSQISAATGLDLPGD